jgi:anti-sigma regulatory factor (Ser/Thr protein kinase)
MSPRAVLGERDFTADATSVSEARRFVVSLLALEPDLGNAVRLAVSELATNAVLHARSPFRVRVSSDGHTLRVAVFDRGHNAVAKKNYGPAAITGRGLTIVEQLSDDWGVTPDSGGKWVWFEVAMASQVLR